MIGLGATGVTSSLLVFPELLWSHVHMISQDRTARGAWVVGAVDDPVTLWLLLNIVDGKKGTLRARVTGEGLHG